MRYYILKALLKLFGALPLCVQRVLGAFVGVVMHYVVRYRLKVVRSNLRLAFPEASDAELRRYERGFYRHFGRIVAETVWMGACGPRRFARSGVLHQTNPELMRSLWEESESGVVLLYSHNCNWEIIGGLTSGRQGGFGEEDTVVAYRRVKDPVWDRIFAENRTHCLPVKFEGYTETSSLVRRVLSGRGKRQCLIMITDQKPYKGFHCPTEVEFFGRRVSTMDGGASLALKLGMKVAYLSLRQTRRGYDLTYIPVEGSTVQEIMDRYYRLLEEDIRRDPCTYLWSHRRWK